MASQTLRPHRSPSPAPDGPHLVNSVNPVNHAKLTRQSLGPPSSTSGAAKGFSALGVGGNAPGAPRHVSSSHALGGATLSPHLGGTRAVSSGHTLGSSARPTSEFMASGLRNESKTPEAQQIDQWFKNLANFEETLEEMAAASTDQNFNEELGAIEQWFRVLSEAERTAALYSLLQHSTPMQIRFFLSVLQHMAQADPMSALLSPNPANAALDAKLGGLNLKSPTMGANAGFAGSPTVNQFLAPGSALDSTSGANKANMTTKSRQNRISAPGTLQPNERWQGQLDQVVERGSSPGVESNTSGRSKSPDLRPKSTDFSGKNGDARSPRMSMGGGLGLVQPQPETASPILSPFLNNASWASMTNTPLVPMFPDAKGEGVAAALNMANLSLNNPSSRVAFDDARQFRRGDRNTSGRYDDNGERIASPLAPQGTWGRSPVLDQFGLGTGLGLGGIGTDPNTLAGLASLGLGGLGHPNTAQMLALAQAQAQVAQNLSPIPGGNGFARSGRNPGVPARKSPLLGKSHSPNPDKQAGGGGAGGGAGVAGPDDVDIKVLQDVGGWLRVLRLHKYTTNFEKSKWKDMVLMTDADLLANGVAAQGARTKFLKVFYNVREKEGIEHPEGQEEYAPTANKENK